MKRYSKRGIITLCSIVYFTSYFARKDFASVYAGMIEEGILTDSTWGFISMAMFALYGVGQIISGILGDKINPKILILAGLGTTMACNLAIPFVSEQWLLVPIWGLNGLAQAMLWPPIVKILSQYLTHDEYVKGNLVVTSAAHVATILLYLYAPLCLMLLDWKAVFISASVLCAIIFVVFIIGLSIVLPKESDVAIPCSAAKDKNSHSNAPATENFAKLLLRTGVFPIFGAIIAMGFLRDGIETWLPRIYAMAFEVKASTSILLSVLIPIFSILSVVLTRILHKKPFRNETLGAGVLFIISVVICIPLYFLMNVKSTVCSLIALLLVALVSGCMHACNFLYISCLPGRFAKHGHAAGASGICNACTYVGAAVSMYGISLVTEKLGANANPVLWGIVAAIGIVCVALSFKKYTAFCNEEE